MTDSTALGREIDLLADYPRTPCDVGWAMGFLIHDLAELIPGIAPMLAWNLTAPTIMHADEWTSFVAEAGYTGDYSWFMP